MIIHLFDFVKGGAPLGKPSLGKKADSRLAEEGLSFSDFLGADQRPRRGRSAGPPFSAMRKRGKNRQRRGLPPPCGIHPAVLGVPASFSFQPLARWGHIDGLPFYGLYLLLCSCVLLPPGPFPGVPLFPANGGLAPGGGDALSGFWFLLPAQKKPPAGSVPTRLASLIRKKRRTHLLELASGREAQKSVL